MFGKVMSIPDRVMLEYFEFATDLSPEALTQVRQGLRDGSLHPRDAKRRLAREIVGMWHGAEAAPRAEAAFDRVFVARELPSEVPDVVLSPGEAPSGRMRLVHLLVALGLAESHGEARRLITQGGVAVDGRRLTDADADVEVYDGLVVRVGRRRFARLRLG
jgi:tyrosyl-tRNA synthetase